MSDRPNILFIFTDQQTFGALSCRGNGYCSTPHLDHLAARGMRFDQCYCPAPVCGPSRAALVTGRTPHEAGVNYNEQSLNPAVPTFGELLRGAGYYAAWIGKWHLPGHYPEASHGNDPRDDEVRGFDYIPLPAGLSTRTGNRGAVTDPSNAFDAAEQLRGQLADQHRPWCLCLSLHNPHDICGAIAAHYPPHRNVERYPPLPDNHELPEGESEFMERCRRRDHYGPQTTRTVDWNEEDWRIYLHTYYHFVEQVDREIGHVLSALESGGWAEDTLIIFTSDHGESVAAHRQVVKLTLYEEAARVPLIVAGPGVPENTVDDRRLTTGLDIAPTICDYTGLDVGNLDFAGRSLRPLIERLDQPGRDYIACELAPDPEDPAVQARMIRSQRYKYIACSHGERPQMLFDLQNDPGEMQNLADDPAMSGVLHQHQQWLGEWIERTEDDFSVVSLSKQA